MTKENPLEKMSNEPVDLTPLVNKKEIEFCVHNSFCHKRKKQGYNCLKPDSNVCGQVKRFYDRYGEAGNQMGVGS